MNVEHIRKQIEALKVKIQRMEQSLVDARTSRELAEFKDRLRYLEELVSVLS